MKSIKRLLTAALSAIAAAGLLAVPVSGWAAEDDIYLIINDFPYEFAADDPRPVLNEGRAYVPLRMVSQALDCQVQWLGDTNQIVIATSEAAGTIPENTGNTLQIVIDHQPLAIDPALGLPYISEQGVTMVPLRAVGNGLGCDVQWQDNVIIIAQRPPAPVDVASRGDDFANSHTANSYEEMTIMGSSIATESQINAFLAAMEPSLRTKAINNGAIFQPYPENIAHLYLTIGAKYGIRGDVALAQALKETGYFQYGGEVEAWQNNFCGLGAIGTPYTEEDQLTGVDPQKVYIIPGLHGLIFSTPAFGVEAHIQHLYSYATDAPLPAGIEKLDPRFNHNNRGAAPLWTGLNGRWAVPGDGYGESVINDYWIKILAY